MSGSKFVVKLGVVKEGEEDPFFRRYSFFMRDGKSTLSSQDVVSMFKHHAILSYVGEISAPEISRCDSQLVDPKDYDVVLYYRDEDNDKVMICSAQDIIEGSVINSKGVDTRTTRHMKILAKVVAINKGNIGNDSKSTASTQTVAKETADKGIEAVVQTKDKSTDVPPKLPDEEKSEEVASENIDLVNSLADLIRCSAAAAQAGVNAAAGVTKAPIQQVKKISETIKVVGDGMGKEVKHMSKTVKYVGNEVTRSARESLRSATQSMSGGSSDKATSDPPSPPRPFIHGRHTCDQCLSTPIIGQRFHALNLPDYDLCATCRGNFKGEDVQFDVVQLDCDAALQDRWHRKLAAAQQGTRRMTCVNRGGPATVYRCLNRHQGHGPCGFYEARRCNLHTDPTAPPSQVASEASGPEVGKTEDATFSEQNDAALNEAIRRSLLDVAVTGNKDEIAEKEEDTEAASEPEIVVEPEEENVEEDDEETFSDLETFSDCQEAPHESELEVTAARKSSSVDSVKDTDDSVAFSADVEESQVEVKESVENEVLAADLAGMSSGVDEYALEVRASSNTAIADSVEDADDSVARSFVVDGSALEVKESGKMSEVDNEFDDDLVDLFTESELEAKESSNKGTSNATKDHVAEDVGCKDTSAVVQEESFASAAAGSGDVAAFVGETLDRMSEAIDGLNSAFDKDIDDHCGTKIIDGDDDSEGVSSSWSVVDDDAQGNDLARATEAVGSALFNSDNNVSTLSHQSGNESHLTSADEESVRVSSVTSVPSTVRSLDTVPAVQLQRWAFQLNTLHELGFRNDVVSVDALERLAAANIGVGSDDEVSVQQVIDELLKEW